MPERVGLSRRARLTIAGAIAVLCAIGIVVLAVQLFSGDDHNSRLAVRFPQRPAGAPFVGYRETHIDIDGTCRPVAIANTPVLRTNGLRNQVQLGPYAGMLFVFDRDTKAAFTMSGVTDPLEIAWYSANGSRVDGAHMAPCPRRGQADCPIYSSRQRYRLALERSGGSAPPPNLTPCS
jgi:uncharacterized membrane protein (UPF0127 family)